MFQLKPLMMTQLEPTKDWGGSRQTDGVSSKVILVFQLAFLFQFALS